MKDLYYDKFNACFTTEIEPVNPPERIVRYYVNDGKGINSEKHFIGEDKYITFEYPENEKDFQKLEGMRDKFFKENGIDDYLTTPGNKYYTVEMKISKEEYERILDVLEGQEK